MKKTSIGGGKLNTKKLCQQITKLQFSFTIQWSNDSDFLRIKIQLEISGKNLLQNTKKCIGCFLYYYIVFLLFKRK